MLVVVVFFNKKTVEEIPRVPQNFIKSIFISNNKDVKFSTIFFVHLLLTNSVLSIALLIYMIGLG